MPAIAIKINPTNPKAKKSNFTIDKQILDFIEEGKLCYLLSSPLSATKSKILSEIKIEASSNYHVCILDNIKMSYQPTFNEYKASKLWYKKIIDTINQEFRCQCTADQWYENTEEEQPEKLFDTYIEDKIVNNNYIQKVIIIFVFNCFEFQINNDINYIIFKNRFWQLIRQFYLKKNTNQRYEKINFILIDDIDSNQFLINSDIFENSLDKHLFFGWGVNVNNLSFDFMKPKLTKFLKEIDRDKFINAIFDRTKGNELLTQAIVQKAFASRKYISKGEESEFIEEIINELGLRRN